MQRIIRFGGLALILLLGACSNVRFNEKRNLGRRIMQFDANDLETSYENKVMFSREVSGGRPGHSAGGGCGCAN
jgi:glycerol uptake facilitator-like aquaporin